MSTDPGTPHVSAPLPATPPDSARVEAVVRELTRMIARDLDLRVEESSIAPDGPLLDGGPLIDSMVLFEFIALIEKQYDVRFDTDRLSSETFASVNELARHILAMEAAGEPG